MSDDEVCFGSSSSEAGTLMKRTPRSASSRGSQIGDMVDRETVAALGQTRQMLGLGLAETAESRLLELQHEGGRERAVGLEEIQALREGRAVGERGGRDISEHADLLVAHHQPP